MQNAITQLLDNLATILGPLSPFTKAVVPAVLAVATALIKSAFDGMIDATSVTIAASGLVLALVVYFVPNRPAVKPAATK